VGGWDKVNEDSVGKGVIATGEGGVTKKEKQGLGSHVSGERGFS